MFGGHFAFSEVAFGDVKMFTREHWRSIIPTGDETWSSISPSGDETWAAISPSGDETWTDIGPRII